MNMMAVEIISMITLSLFISTQKMLNFILMLKRMQSFWEIIKSQLRQGLNILDTKKHRWLLQKVQPKLIFVLLILLLDSVFQQKLFHLAILSHMLRLWMLKLILIGLTSAFISVVISLQILQICCCLYLKEKLLDKLKTFLFKL